MTLAAATLSAVVPPLSACCIETTTTGAQVGSNAKATSAARLVQGAPRVRECDLPPVRHCSIGTYAGAAKRPEAPIALTCPSSKRAPSVQEYGGRDGGRGGGGSDGGAAGDGGAIGGRRGLGGGRGGCDGGGGGDGDGSSGAYEWDRTGAGGTRRVHVQREGYDGGRSDQHWRLGGSIEREQERRATLPAHMHVRACVSGAHFAKRSRRRQVAIGCTTPPEAAVAGADATVSLTSFEATTILIAPVCAIFGVVQGGLLVHSEAIDSKVEQHLLAALPVGGGQRDRHRQGVPPAAIGALLVVLRRRSGVVRQTLAASRTGWHVVRTKDRFPQ
eukprot:2644742-Prymnesium_polylepis.2